MSFIIRPAMRPMLRAANKPVALHRLSPKLQKRFAQVHDVRFYVTHHDPASQILERYKEKLNEKAQKEGHESIDSLKDAYKEKIKEMREKATVSPEELLARAKAEIAANEAQTAQAKGAAPSSPSSQAAPQAPKIDPSTHKIREAKKSGAPGIRPLSSYLELSKVKDLPPREIEALWRLRHAQNPNAICAVIPIDTYLRMAGTAKLNPRFVLPLPRKLVGVEEGKGSEKTKVVSDENPSEGVGAAEIHFLQWGFHPPAGIEQGAPVPKGSRNNHTSTVIFTHLAQYKLHGTYAEPHTVLTHHLDLADDKGLVLMNGTILPDKGISNADAQLLSMWVQKFYDWGVEASKGGRKAELLRCFTAGDPTGFKIEDLMDEVERL